MAIAWDDRPYAMLATAVTSVAMVSPSLLVCVNRDASAYAGLRHRGAFSLGILAAQHHRLGASLGRATATERFAHGH